MKLKKSNIGIIDATLSGVSGDKYLGALIDLGAKIENLKHVAKIVADVLPGTRRIDIETSSVERGDVAAKLVTVKSKEDVSERKGSIIRASIQKAAAKLDLSNSAKSLSLSIVDTLLAAESHVHGHSIKEVTLHELGSADTLVDILGTAHLLEQLGLSETNWWSSSIAVGEGTTRFSGRDYPVPPPAVAEILRRHKYPMILGRADGELSTPTGVAITVNLAPQLSRAYPALKPEKIGYGAGSKDFDQVANVLRLITGEDIGSMHSHDQMVVLETNLDDVSGEVIGRAVEQLMMSGARDVTVTPVYMKKNRPGHIISVIANKEDAENLADVLISETGTFGVRELPVTRHISARRTSTVTLQVNGSPYDIKLKSSLDKSGEILNSKLEYEDLRRISRQTGRSIRELQSIAKPSLKPFPKKRQRSMKKTLNHG